MNTDAVWTDDPTYKVVQLRNRILDLVENRIAEVTGVTDREEFYVLTLGDDRYALARVRNGEIIEGCYFERGWPGNLNSAFPDLQITPRMLEIRGSYKITQTKDPKTPTITLTFEDRSSNS
ncbi:MAG: hypothetical protein LC794_08070 [Acidobacteria bacterium]|nr:hypothetical protein [Acidobacteriota bacterium]